MTVVKNWRTDSPELATAMFCRGLILNKTGDVAAALEMLREAHKARWKILGRDDEKKSHPMLSECLLHIGITYLLQGRVNRAITKIEEAHDMRLEYFKESHFSVLEAKYNHGMALLATGVYCQALDVHNFVLRERLGVPISSYAPIVTVPVRDDVCDSLVAVGMCYLYLGITPLQSIHPYNRQIVSIHTPYWYIKSPYQYTPSTHLSTHLLFCPIIPSLGQLHAADRMVSEALRVLLILFGGKNDKKNIGTSLLTNTHPHRHTQTLTSSQPTFSTQLIKTCYLRTLKIIAPSQHNLSKHSIYVPSRASQGRRRYVLAGGDKEKHGEL